METKKEDSKERKEKQHGNKIVITVAVVSLLQSALPEGAKPLSI